MEIYYCKYDTHEKEIQCPYYEKGKQEKLGCYCKFMDTDHCHNLSRFERGKNENPRS